MIIQGVSNFRNGGTKFSDNVLYCYFIIHSLEDEQRYANFA